MRGILILLVSLAACSDKDSGGGNRPPTVVIELPSSSSRIVVNGVSVADSRKLGAVADALKPLIPRGADAGRVVVRADRSVTAGRIFRVLTALYLNGNRKVRFESLDPEWRVAPLEYDLPSEHGRLERNRLHCLGILVLADSEGKVDFGDGHVERNEWKRWLFASTGSPRVDFSVGELCFPMDAPFEVFHRLLNDMLSAELDLVYVGWAEPYSHSLGARMFVWRRWRYPSIPWLR